MRGEEGKAILTSSIDFYPLVMVQSEIMSVLADCDLMKWLKASETRGRILATAGTGVVWLDLHPNRSGPLRCLIT